MWLLYEYAYTSTNVCYNYSYTIVLMDISGSLIPVSDSSQHFFMWLKYLICPLRIVQREMNKVICK